MFYKVCLNKTDNVMVELWQTYNKKPYLVAVFHMDAFLGNDELNTALNNGETVDIEIRVL